MFKSLIQSVLLITLAAAGTVSYAEGHPYMGVSIFNLSEDIDEINEDVSINGFLLGIGYRNQVSDTFALAPEIRIGTGGSDSFAYQGVSIETEIERLMAFSVRAEFHPNERGYVFFAPSYARLDIKATARVAGFTFSDENGENEAGFGFGAGYSFSDKSVTELRFEDYDGTSVYSVATNFHF